MSTKPTHADVRLTTKGDYLKLSQSSSKYGSNVLHDIELNKAQAAKLVEALAKWLDAK